MKSIKGLSMGKVLGGLRKKPSSGSNTPTGNPSDAPPPSGSTARETPEATAHNSVKAFCEAGGSVKGDEVLFLPPIVDAAESSPAAAAECARLIRKFISKEYNSRPSWQYNAIMLVRILTDNPGETFTRNLDQKFVDTAQALLKNSKDASVRQILMETLDDFENTKMDDPNLALIVSMWKKEKEEAYKKFGQGRPSRRRRDHSSQAQQFGAHAQNHHMARHQDPRALPPPVELVGRLEEARTSAKLLEQVVMNTPPHEILGNELIKEFADRCRTASSSIQGYMASQNPVPDNDTMESLIDTNEQLQTALNQHQRAMLSARKQMGLQERTDSDGPPSAGAEPQMHGANNQLLPRQDSELSQGGGLLPLAAPSGSSGYANGNGNGNGKGKATEQSYAPPPGPPPGMSAATGSGSGSGSGSGAVAAPSRPRQDEVWEDPFADPQEGDRAAASSHNNNNYGNNNGYADQRHAEDPFHPGGFSNDKAPARRPIDDDEDDIYDSPVRKEPASRF